MADDPGVFFVATAHDEYRARRFPPGSVVIDPWRMVEDQPGVTVRRLGENKPALISLLVPSRGRPGWFERMQASMMRTVLHPSRVEIVFRLDDDDPEVDRYPRSMDWSVSQRLVGPRALLSECWNECARAAKGEILMHLGDDVTFDTNGWDQIVRDAFEQVPDRILFAHGDDLGPHGQTFGTHGFIHRRWMNEVGYFVPPLFSSDWNDVWLNEVANELDRRVLLPIVTEHHHYTFDKAPRDATHAEREDRGARDDVVALYKRTRREREGDIAKLRALMSE